MRLSVEDPRTGRIQPLEVKEHHKIEGIIDVLIKQMGIISAEQRSYALVLHEQELPNSISIEQAIHKFGLKENDKLTLWTRVIGGT
jgi:hypothetical protein